MRAKIWRAHVPKDVKVDEDVDFDYLALKYELTGGDEYIHIYVPRG